jgi:gliding motility-associated-like protein
MGTTTGNWAITPGVGFSQASGRQFISKLQPDLSGYVYSTAFGKGGAFPDISPTAFLVDRCENVYVAGWGGGINESEHYNNSGTTGLPVTGNALHPNTDGDDFYFFVLQKNGASQLYGDFFGQVGGQLGDHVDGGTSRFDKQGVIYQSICANCYGPANLFPTTPAAYAKANGTGTTACNEAAVKISFNFAGVSAGLKLTLHGRGDSVGCTPLLVGLQDTVRNAKSYIWDFGDGVRDTTTAYSLEHSYSAVGVYTVALVAIDSNSCNVADTVYRTITVKDNPAFLAFDITKLPPCTSFNYLFDNESTHSANSPAFGDSSFLWNFGDGTGSFYAGLGNTSHSYGAPGPYTVSLILVDTNYCNYPDTLTRPFYVAQNVSARFTTPPFGCAPYTAVFNNTSIAGSKYYWDFGDGSPIDSVDVSPSHLYSNVGSFTVRLTAIDSTTCNIISDTSFIITVQGKPTAGFTFVPSPPTPNTPTIFTDASSPAVKYQWSFGDGGSETKTTPDTVMHQYNRTDTFRVCLIVTNESGCTDTICHLVPALINPLLDVPNAFTPGRFGQNGIVKVVGFGITHIVFRIYNRWGQMVFQSNDPNIGWDGTYRGILQPMDVYAYTLEAEYFDGTRATKKGDITLIR